MFLKDMSLFLYRNSPYTEEQNKRLIYINFSVSSIL